MAIFDASSFAASPVGGLIQGAKSLANTVTGTISSAGTSISNLFTKNSSQFQATPQSAPPVLSSANPSQVISNSKQAQTLKGLIYPPELQDSETYVYFGFADYDRRKINSDVVITTKKDVYLPMPGISLHDHHQTNWSTSDLGPILGGVEHLISKTAATLQNGPDMKGWSGRQLLDYYEDKFDWSDIGKQAAGWGWALGLDVVAASALGPQVAAVTGANIGSGIALNPYISVLLRGPTLRSHTFAWRFAPNNITDTNTVDQICQTFKKAALVKSKYDQGATGAVFGYPDMLKIELTPDTYLFKYKLCVITNVSVNYSPTGLVSLFDKTNAPTMVELQVSVQEIEIFTDADISDSNKTVVTDSSQSTPPTPGIKPIELPPPVTVDGPVSAPPDDSNPEDVLSSMNNSAISDDRIAKYGPNDPVTGNPAAISGAYNEDGTPNTSSSAYHTLYAWQTDTSSSGGAGSKAAIGVDPEHAATQFKANNPPPT